MLNAVFYFCEIINTICDAGYWNISVLVNEFEGFYETGRFIAVCRGQW
jgi:hypothetical protein